MVDGEVDGQRVFPFYFFFYVLDWWSDAKLTGLCRWSWSVLGASMGGLGCWGASVGGLGPLLGPLCAVLGRSAGFCGRSWVALSTSVGGLGSVLGIMFSVVGRSCGDLGPLLGPLAVLGFLGVKSPGKAIWQRLWPE